MDKLRELSERWRAESERLYPDRDDAMALSPDIRYELEGRCEQLDACADELDALRAQLAGGGEVEPPAAIAWIADSTWDKLVMGPKALAATLYGFKPFPRRPDMRGKHKRIAIYLAPTKETES